MEEGVTKDQVIRKKRRESDIHVDSPSRPSRTKRHKRRKLHHHSRRIKLPNSTRCFVACKQNWRCNICRETLPPEFDVDHIQPLAANGTNAIENLQVLCVSCHRNKSYFEEQRRIAHNQEKRTGRSKYFEPSLFLHLLQTQHERQKIERQNNKAATLSESEAEKNKYVTVAVKIKSLHEKKNV